MARIDNILLWLVKMFPNKDINWIRLRALSLIGELNKLYKETRGI